MEQSLLLGDYGLGIYHASYNDVVLPHFFAYQDTAFDLDRF
jgi:hypothetical protein